MFLRKPYIAAACGALLLLSQAASAQTGTGTLQFQANGEELAIKGFKAPKLTKDGWTLKFSNIYISVADVTAWQSVPSYNAEKGGEIAAKVKAGLPGRHVLDLVKGAGKDGLVRAGQVQAPAGHYNALSWKMVKAESGPAAGYTTVFVGKASKGGKTVPFQLVSNEEVTYRCGEYVGDERKGLLKAGGKGNAEMTFHLDHIFGNAELGAGDALNKGAIGFEPFAKGGKQSIALKGQHIGHSGEGHCNVQWH